MLFCIHLFHKIAAVTPDHYSLTDENRTCGIKTLDSTRLALLDSTRLCWCVRTAAAAILSKPQRACRILVSLTGLDWTRLDSVGVYAALQRKETQNPQCLQQGLKISLVPQSFLYVPDEWCVVHP